MAAGGIFDEINSSHEHAMEELSLGSKQVVFSPNSMSRIGFH
jgi:hypothetical protein